MPLIVKILLTLLSLSMLGQTPGVVTRGDLMKRSEYQTFDALPLFVDSLGSDDNDCLGTGVNACLTIAGALSRVPKLINTPVTISIASGSFAGAQVSGFTIGEARSTAAGAYLSIIGTLVTSTTLLSGPTTGTFDSGTAGTASPAVFGTATKLLAGWTVNDLRGRFIEITGGTGSGQVKVIQSNTVDTITIAGTFSPSPNGTSTFALRDSGTNITSGVVVPASINGAAGVTPNGFLITSNTGDATASGTSLSVGVSQCKFTNVGIGVTATGATKLLLRRNQFMVTAGGVFLTKNASINLDTNALMLAAAQIGLTVGSDVSSTFVTQNLIRGGSIGVSTANVSSWMMLGTAIEAQTSSGISMNGGVGQAQLNGNRFDCAGVGAGIFVLSSFSGGKLGVDLGGSGGDISSCVTGIDASGTHHFSLAAVWSGAGNTTAISVSKGSALQLSAASTITGVTELSIDGTAFTVAAMRAAVPKVISDINHGSRVYE